MKNEVYNKLYNLRLKNNYSCKDMADKLGISKAFYWQIENKERKLNYLMAKNIANIFNLRPDDIFYDEIN